ncbi:AAA family ATPase [Pseudoalteromonas sp. AS71]|uniref:McrB family protein n=1 Tax=Pseudoalteromonas sp. AS71 TaxID=3135777 RepID=UPI003176FC1F
MNDFRKRLLEGLSKPFEVKPVSDNSADNYLSGLNRIEEDYGSKVFNLEIPALIDLYDIYKVNGNKEEVGNTYNGAARAALKKLLDFKVADFFIHFIGQKEFVEVIQNEKHRNELAKFIYTLHKKGFDWFFTDNKRSPLKAGRKKKRKKIATQGFVKIAYSKSSYTVSYTSPSVKSEYGKEPFDLEKIDYNDIKNESYGANFLAKWPPYDGIGLLPAGYSKNRELTKNSEGKPVSSPNGRLKEVKMSKNVIYFGPPGTGKTYTLQKRLKEKYTGTGTSEELGVWLNSKLNDLSWFEIITLILLAADNDLSVTDIVNHEYFTKKLALNGRTAQFRQTAWSALQVHAIRESKTIKYEKRTEPLIFDKTEKSNWFIVNKGDELLVGYKELLNELKAGPPVEKEIKRFEFVTFHQSYGYEEFIEGLRPVTNDDGDISYVVKPGILKRLCKRAEADANHQYALVIDEINRGNISKIFGELISLIEIDKRAGEEHSLTVTLPYSNLPFSVPSNLDIIGTMNTADRSLTHIDIALRRRFEFIELRTKYKLLKSDVDGIDVRKLLFTINKRIELLLDREHIIGHALLMKVSNLADLKQVFITNIIPLLEEYFFEDWDKIKQVFNGNRFVSELKDAHTTWLGDSDEYAAKSYFVDRKAFDEIENYTAVYQGIDDKNFAALFSEQEQN